MGYWFGLSFFGAPTDLGYLSKAVQKAIKICASAELTLWMN